MNNQVYIDKNFGWFIGGFDTNQKHRHYALQLSIPLNGPIVIQTSQNTLQSEHPVLIKSNVGHQIISNSNHFLLLINPASTIGHYWNQFTHTDITEVKIAPAMELKNLLLENNHGSRLTSGLNFIIQKYDCFCTSAIHKGDRRIDQALSYLLTHSESVVPVEEVASYCNLSPGRFLHLFKEQTGITFRRAQLWNKLTKSVSQLEDMSLTEIAHQNGFSDSAHFSRTFKENFGFNPRDFIKISRFVQV